MKKLDQEKLDALFMQQALIEAKKSFDEGEVPVGAVLVFQEKIIARGRNLTETLQKATAHAEILCLEAGSLVLSNWRLLETTLYVTLEPCSMCFGALLLSRVKRVVYGAKDHRHGALGSWVDLSELKHPTHHLEVVGGVCAEESEQLLKTFFKVVRQRKI